MLEHVNAALRVLDDCASASSGGNGRILPAAYHGLLTKPVTEIVASALQGNQGLTPEGNAAFDALADAVRLDRGAWLLLANTPGVKKWPPVNIPPELGYATALFDSLRVALTALRKTLSPSTETPQETSDVAADLQRANACAVECVERANGIVTAVNFFAPMTNNEAKADARLIDVARNVDALNESTGNLLRQLACPSTVEGFRQSRFELRHEIPSWLQGSRSVHEAVVSIASNVAATAHNSALAAGSALERWGAVVSAIRRLPAIDVLAMLDNEYRHALAVIRQPVGNAGSTPAAAKTEQGEGNGGGGTAPAKEQSPDAPTRESVLRGLEPAVREAYLALEYAETLNGRRLKGHEAYDWLNENGIDPDKGNPGQGMDYGGLMDYELPTYSTWSRQVRKARQRLGEQRNTPRKGRPTGRSIVSGREIENRRGNNR